MLQESDVRDFGVVLGRVDFVALLPHVFLFALKLTMLVCIQYLMMT